MLLLLLLLFFSSIALLLAICYNFYMPEKKLPPKQRLFLKEWLIDKNASEAYKRAYKYKGDNANVLGPALLARLGKEGFVEPELKKQEEKTGLTAEYIIKSLMEVAERCKQAIAVMEKGEDGELHETGEWKFDSAGANRALELLGKHLKLFTDKIEHSGKMTLEQILAKTDGDKGEDKDE